MKEYPATSKQFKANGKVHKMKKYTLGLQADIEDENTTVTYVDVIRTCTDMNTDEINALTSDQMEAIVSDIQGFTYEKASEAGGEPKKP